MSSFTPDFSKIVLIVEDEELLRSSISELLRDADFEVLEAGNAADALSLIEARPDIHIVFTDIQMPDVLDGMQLAEKVHEKWPAVLLLITSGNRRPSATDLPGHGRFLAKPYRVEEVLEEIDTLVREATTR